MSEIKKIYSLIMIADDDVDDRDLFKEAMYDCDPGITVINASGGNELMDKLSDGKLPDLIFLDLNMPGKEGKECLTEIRSDGRLKTIPVIIYSTSLSEKDINDTYNLGANLYISKPNSFKGLIVVLKRLLMLDINQIGRTKENYLFNLLHQE